MRKRGIGREKMNTTFWYVNPMGKIACYRLGNNIKMELKRIGLEIVDRIYLVHDGDQSMVLVGKVMKTLRP
jgi:hypothetical protein